MKRVNESEVQFYFQHKQFHEIGGDRGKCKFPSSLTEFPISIVLFTRRMGPSSTSCAFNYQNVILHRENGLEVNIRYVDSPNVEEYFCRKCVVTT
jgi:hypothetical protein